MQKKLKTAIIAGLAVGFFAAQDAAAAVLDIDASGRLAGAFGVMVGGSSYDVEFVDGTCVDLFDGCNANTDFDFIGLTNVQAAAQALLDQVFLDGPLGNFDTQPGLTVGCNSLSANPLVCEVYIPIELVVGASSPRFTAGGVSNRIDDGRVVPVTGRVTDVLFRGQLSTTLDTSVANVKGSTFALFSESPVAVVPLPASGWGLLAALGSLLAIGRRRRARQAG